MIDEKVVAGTPKPVESNKSVKGNAKKSTCKTAPIDKIRLRALTLFKYSLQKDAAEKALCLQKAIHYYQGKMTYSEDDFKKDFYKRVCVLTDSTSFCNYCKDHGFQSFSAATHIVFYNSKTKLGKLILYGDYSIFSSYQEWKTPIYEEEDLKSHFYGSSVSDSSEKKGDNE